MIGEVIGNYRCERVLGEGGMSQVYVGRTIGATSVLPEGYLVVMKVMAAELANEQVARKRFIKEGQILSQLRHRYITRFYEFIPRESGGVLVMEFADGTPVDRLIAEKGYLDIPDAVAITSSLLEALAYAHGRGIIHRDVKPGNLIRQKTGGLKVTDFGIAKIKEETTSSGERQTVLTRAGFLLGTPHYMSPEQIRDPKDAGASCDVYSSAVVLYEMLAGTLPFTQRSLPKLIEAIYRGDKKPPSAWRTRIDPELDAIVLTAMQPDPSRRYASAQAFFDALEAYRSRRLDSAPAEVDLDDATVRTGGEEPQVAWSLVAPRDGGEEIHEIRGSSVMIGRDRSCAIVLVHPAVSRRHARITVNESSFLLEDLKSANGTYVNNTRVERANLKAGDIVRFGADPTCSYSIQARRE